MEKYNVMIMSVDKKTFDVVKTSMTSLLPGFLSFEFSTLSFGNVKLIEKKKIDLLFIDIDAIEEASFAFLEKIKSVDLRIILISSFEKFAVNAIEFDIVSGYLIKPLDLDEVKHLSRKILDKIIFLKEVQANELRTREYRLNFLAVSSVDKIDFVKLEDILFCEADGRYTTFFLENGKTIVSSKNLGGYEKILKNKSFFRIHHRYLVNLEKVIKIDKAGGNYCILGKEKSLPVAKRKQELLIRYLKIK